MDIMKILAVWGVLKSVIASWAKPNEAILRK